MGASQVLQKAGGIAAARKSASSAAQRSYISASFGGGNMPHEASVLPTARRR
jgi:hypothetical protein